MSLVIVLTCSNMTAAIEAMTRVSMKKLCYWQFVQSRRISINRIDSWTQVSGSCFFWVHSCHFQMCTYILGWIGDSNCMPKLPSLNLLQVHVVNEDLGNETTISLLCNQSFQLTGCSAKDTEAAGLVGLISWRSPTLSSPLSEGNAAGKRRLIREC
ncbi:unnamed protein product [Musa textilis]